MQRATLSLFFAVIIILTAAGSVFAVSSHDIQKRIDRLQADIDRGIDTEALTVKKIRRMQATLDDIRKDFRRAKRYPPFSLKEKKALGRRLDSLELEIRALKKIPTKESPVEKLLKERNALEDRIDKLYQKISELREKNRLTLLEARELRENLDEVARKETLTPEDIESFNLRLDEVDEEIAYLTRKPRKRSTLAKKQEELDKRIIRLRSKIKEYRKNGWIRRSDSKVLREDLDDIEYDLKQMTDEERLTMEDAEVIEDRLEDLEFEISALKEKYEKKRLPEELAEKRNAIDEKIDRLHRRISDLRKKGRLTLAEARVLRTDLDDIEGDLMRKVRKKTLTHRDIEVFSERLDAVLKKIEAMRNKPRPSPPPPPPLRPRR
jgi:chromosome segregation ATPase